MKRSIAILFTLCLFVGLQMMGGCAVYDVAVEERNASEWANDKNISFAIEEQFLEDDSIKFMDFDAYTYEGHVYLIGEYESRAQTDQAVKIAKSVEGVQKITTYFLPKKAYDHCGTTDNVEINATLRQKLISDEDIWSTNLDVEMIQCEVVLLGIVGSYEQKAAAVAHAKSIPGVRKVKDYIKVSK